MAEKIESLKITVEVKTSKRIEKKAFASVDEFEDYQEDFLDRTGVSLDGEGDEEEDGEEEEEEEEGDEDPDGD